MEYQALICRRNLVDNISCMNQHDFFKVLNKLQASELEDIKDQFMIRAIRYFAFHGMVKTSRQKDYFFCNLINVVID